MSFLFSVLWRLCAAQLAANNELFVCVLFLGSGFGAVFDCLELLAVFSVVSFLFSVIWRLCVAQLAANEVLFVGNWLLGLVV